MSKSAHSLEDFREEAKEWLRENFPASIAGRGVELMAGEFVNDEDPDLKLWIERLGQKGWGVPTWPSEYGGGGLSQNEAKILGEELSLADAFNPLTRLAGMGITMVGPTILEYGTEAQKRQHIPKICTAEVFWALGYSEPNAGSDLASLACKAEDKGDHWLVNGQKTWTSGADLAQWIGVLVRTDLDKPKRDGISFLMLDMDQPGIETRPIQLIGGASPFCETFLNDARADKDQMLGELNAGWTVGKRLLQHERQSQTRSPAESSAKRKATINDIAKQYVGTDESGKLSDRDLRSRMSSHLMRAHAHRLTLNRIAAEARGNLKVNAVVSILKNAASDVAQEKSELLVEILGHSGLGWEGDEFSDFELETLRSWLSSKSISIYGGSYEIQNNIIAKNILGLPENTQRG